MEAREILQMNRFKLSNGTLSTDEQRKKLHDASHQGILKRRREKYHRTKGLTAAQIMMGETK